MSIETDIYSGLIAATEAARDAIDPELRIAYPQIEFNPLNNETYLEIRHFKNTNINPTWDASKILQGIWQVSVVVNGDQIGELPPTEIASVIENHFKKNTRIFIGEDGRSIKIYQSPTVLTAIVDLGKTIYPVSVPYQCLKMGDD